MTDPFHYVNPVFIVLSSGWTGVLTAVASFFFASSAIVLSLRKSPGGDILFAGCVRLQFLFSLFWLNHNIYFSYCYWCSTLDKVSWLKDQTCLIMGGAYLFSLLVISLVAGKLGGKRNIECTMLDVFGLTAATLGVVLNFVIKNIMCITDIK
jgi:hypothetical protein